MTDMELIRKAYTDMYDAMIRKDRAGLGRVLDDGFVLIIDMDNREINVRTSGAAIPYMTDERQERLLFLFRYCLTAGYRCCIVCITRGNTKHTKEHSISYDH